MDYVAARTFMPLADWSVTVLLPTGPLLWQARLAGAVLFMLFALLGAAGTVVLQRRARLAERIALTELARVNSNLAAEVVERTTTEEVLRRTQADLVQAGKLAALGQMSAALSH